MLISKIDGLAVRPSGPWIERKFFYLTRYADIFTRGMGKKWGQDGLTYIDLFAGPGRCLIESNGQERDGSPLIALNYEFSKYILVESDPNNLAALRQRCKKSPRNRHPIQHGYSEELQAVSAKQGSNQAGSFPWWKY